MFFTTALFSVLRNVTTLIGETYTIYKYQETHYGIVWHWKASEIEI